MSSNNGQMINRERQVSGSRDMLIAGGHRLGSSRGQAGKVVVEVVNLNMTRMIKYVHNRVPEKTVL